MGHFVGFVIDDVYRSSSHRIGNDLYGMLLPQAIRYFRAVGYFSSTAFNVASEEFLAFFSQGRRMDLVCSQWLSAEDMDAMVSAVFERPKVRSSLRLEELRSSGSATGKSIPGRLSGVCGQCLPKDRRTGCRLATTGRVAGQDQAPVRRRPFGGKKLHLRPTPGARQSGDREIATMA